MSPIDLPYRPLPVWYWLVEHVWRIEHAFERAKARRVERDTPIRIFFVLAIFIAAFATQGLIAAKRAVLSGDAAAMGAPAPVLARADLTDRNGQLLATDINQFGMYVVPDEVWSKTETRQGLAPFLNPASLARLERAFRTGRRGYVLGGLTPQQKIAIHDLGLPGVVFEEEPHRAYPAGATAAHLIGFSDRGGVGIAGAERALDDLIRDEGAKGQPVALSIDMRVQAALEDELQKAAMSFQPKGAVGIVTNVHTGEILGLASYPDYDPNRSGKATDDQRLDRGAAAVYEMGSTFKAFTTAIGLDTGVATPESTFDATHPFQLGYRTIHDYHGTNRVLTLIDVFIHSSNIGTARLAEAIGAQRLSQYFDRLGLTRPAKIELMESARPLTPKKWDDDAVASTSFGHGMNVSPLAVAQAMNALLNGGVMRPLTIRKLDGPPPKGQRVVSEHTSADMLKIMRATVDRGTGGKAQAPGLVVGGKTGTGEKYDPAIRGYSSTKQVSSFAATFPSDGPTSAPRYFVLILMDEPHGNAQSFGFSTGGWVAAPAAGRVIDRIAPYLGVARRRDIAVAAAETPDPGGGL
ncbi:MAG: peptidoglycan D,D-transpeptidase FtsI family protein [Caulobacteraceae bacterium]